MAIIAPSIVIVPITIAISRFRSLDKPGKILLGYLFLNGLVGLIMTILGYCRLPNLGFYHFASVFLTIQLLLFFRSIIASKLLRKLILISIFLFPILEIFNTIYFQPLSQFNSYMLSLQCILIIVCSFLYWMNKEPEENLKWTDSSQNFMVTGLLLYFSSAFFVFNFSNYITQLLRTENIFIWNIHAAITIILYIFIAKGYYKFKRSMDNLALLITLSVLVVIIIISGLVYLQINNQNKLLKKQKEIAAAKANHQENLLQTVITSQEIERKRIGNDLHDEVGAVLSSLRMLIEKNNEQSKDESNAQFAVKSKEIIDRVVTKVRLISHNLSPYISGEFGFLDALYELCDDVNASGKLNVIPLFSESDVPKNIDQQTALAVYRVLAELINNSIKHAKASAIEIEIKSSERLVSFYYRDNGIGLKNNNAKSNSGLGMQNIEGRLNMIKADWAIMEQEEGGFNMRFNCQV